MRLIIRGALILVAVALGSAANAQLVIPGGSGAPPSTVPTAGTITQFNAAQFAQIFTAAGFPSTASLGGSDNKTPYVQINMWGTTTDTEIDGSACDSNGTCSAYSISTYLPNQQGIGDPWTDAWNAQWLYVKAMKVGDTLVLKWNVFLGPGVTRDYVAATAAQYKAVVDNASTFNPSMTSK